MIRHLPVNRSVLKALILCIGAGGLWPFLSTARADDGEGFAATATSGPVAWKHYEVRGVQFGMSRKQLIAMGFTCGESPRSSCKKFMDDRCKKGTCKIMVEDDAVKTTLNGRAVDLDYMACKTTETEGALVNHCRLQITPRRSLGPDTPFGKALIEKYGPYVKLFPDVHDPRDPQGGGRMLWWNLDLGNTGPMLEASCESPIDPLSDKPVEHQCTIEISDKGVSHMEQEKQDAADAQRKQSSQPAAPAL